MQIFISYKSEYRPFAAQVRDQLRAWGFRTWFDQDDIPEGAYFRHEIQKGLESSDAVVGIMTAEAFQSREVMWEWDYALYNSQFIPVRYEDVPLPYHLQGQQYIDFVADVQRGFEQLRTALSVFTPGRGLMRQTATTETSPAPSIAIGRDAHGENVNIGGKQVIQYFFDTDEDEGELLREHIAPTTEQGKTNRQRMLDKVHETWIIGALEKIIHKNNALEIGLVNAPNAVLRHRDYGDYVLPDSSHDIAQIFNDMHRELLILGAPGSGKTVLMLQLAQRLIAKAQEDPNQPIPVVFNLSSWAADRKPLNKWLVDELRLRYRIPQDTASDWVEREQLMLLLDGLDEVTLKHRNACVEAINMFHDTYRLTDLVVCSRIADYHVLTSQLRLQGAIALQPLTQQQITDYTTNDVLSGLRTLLENHPRLQTLAEVPFLLSTMVYTYYEVNHVAVPEDSADGVDKWMNQLFEDYVEKRLREDHANSPYPPRDTIHYLQWLAGKMVHNRQTVFYIESLNFDWFNHPWQQQLRYPLAISTGFVFGALSGAFTGYLAGNLADIAQVGGLTGCVAGAVVGAYFGFYSVRNGQNDIVTGKLKWRWNWWALPFGLVISVLTGVVAALTTEQTIGYAAGIGINALFLPAMFLGMGLYPSSEVETTTKPNEGVSITVNNSLRFGILAAILSMITAVIAMLLSYGVLLVMPPVTYMWFMPGLASMFVDGVGKFIYATVAISLAFGAALGIGLAGGAAVIGYYAGRSLLVNDGSTPRNYIKFLDYAATNLQMMRRVGGGYIFRHRYLLEYFAGQKLE